MTLNLLQCVKHYTNENQKRSTSEEMRKLLLNIQHTRESRHTGNDSQEYGSGEGDARHDFVQIVSRILSGANSGDKTIITLYVLCHLTGVHRNGRIEIGKCDDQQRK